MEIEWLSINFKGDITQNIQVEAGSSHDDICLNLLAGFGHDAFFRKSFDFVGNNTRLAAGDAMEKITIRDKSHALAPGAISGREMSSDIIIVTDDAANAIQ